MPSAEQQPESLNIQLLVDSIPALIHTARPDGCIDYFNRPGLDYLGATLDDVTGSKWTAFASTKLASLRCYIFSRSLPEGERDGAIFLREEPKRFVEELRKKKGKDIWLIGGGELTREFLKEDLVDEIYLGIVPVLIGEGIPLFAAGFPQREFTLTESKTYSGGLIAVKYERERGKAAVKVKSTSKSKRKR
jgi:dihydrofolate reductase